MRELLQLLLRGHSLRVPLLLRLLTATGARMHFVLRIDMLLVSLRATAIMVLRVVSVELVLEIMNDILLISRMVRTRMLVQRNLILLKHHPMQILFRVIA